MPVSKKSPKKWSKKNTRSGSLVDTKRRVFLMKAAVGRHVDKLDKQFKTVTDYPFKKKTLKTFTAEMSVLTKVAADIHKRVHWCDELPSEAASAEARAANESLQANDDEGDNIKRYTKDELLRIRCLPLCKKRPDCLNKPGCMAIGCWALNRRGVDSLDDDLVSKDAPNDKRRPGDPRERIRKESEGIVLSPQRRSFTSGCFVMTGNINNNRLRPDSPIFSQQEQKNEIGSRDAPRRIGPGRIMNRDTISWERSGDLIDDPLNAPDYIPYRAPGSQRDRGDDRYERRSFGRDIYNAGEKSRADRDRDREIADSRFAERRERDDMRRGNRYINDRRRGFEKDEEPEWFSGGPTSQNETIELRGFDDPIPTTTNSTTVNSSSAVDSIASTAASSSTTTTATTQVRSMRHLTGTGRTPSGRTTSQPKEIPPNIEELYKDEIESQKDRIATVFENNPNKEDDNKSKSKTADSDKSKPAPSDDNRMKMDNLLDFNMDDFLKLDLGLNESTEDGYSGGSRFSRWFKRDSPSGTSGGQPFTGPQIIGNAVPTSNPPTAAQPIPPNQDQRGMNEQMFHNMMNDLDTSISIPNNDSQHLFAPISPAASTTPAHNSLLEMLRRGRSQQQHPPQHLQAFQHQHKTMENMPMKIHSLEELEAQIRGPIQPQHQQQMQKNNTHHNRPPQDDSSAFKRLIEQMYEGRAVSATNGPIPQQPNQQPMSILQMLNKSQQADQAALEAQQQQHPPNVSQDLLCKLLQVQQNPQENVNKMMHGHMNHNNRHFQQVSPIPNELPPHVGNVLSRDLLQRPEAQAIIQGLKQGEITPQNLMQQMGNPALQSRHREVIASILKHHQQHQQQQQQQQTSSPRARLILPQQANQQQLSPLPPNAYCVSPIMATSPNTLTVHHPAISQRIPSPRELQAHTQSIMQGALIKKKLEEQKENYRRRQEQSGPLAARTTTPAPVASPTKHPAALAFTPTSVLRKMTAEKETDHMLPKAAGWGAPPLHTQQSPVPKHARPIVKGNTGGNMNMNMNTYQPSPDYSSAAYVNHLPQQQFPNNLMQQQQQQQAVAARNKIGNQSHHQFHAMVMQRQQMQAPQHQHQQVPMQNNRTGPISGNGTNLQQLLVHPHHRNHNEGVSNMGPALSPTSNQLARWFTPELLAQATAGKLPSVNMAQNVLSLEELERMQHSEAIVHN